MSIFTSVGQKQRTKQILREVAEAEAVGCIFAGTESQNGNPG